MTLSRTPSSRTPLPRTAVPRTTIVPDPAAAARAVADEIQALVASKPDAVLGLATGRSMVSLYAELVRRHREGELSLARVTTFNLDEYLGLPAGDPRTFRAFMREHLFRHVDLDPERAHVPAPEEAEADVEGYCRRWERAIEDAGGLDLQLLGLGRNGHVAFNEPGSPRDSRTRRVTLDAITREDAASAFGGLEHVPREALTAGVATLLGARRLRVLAFGPGKAPVLRRVLTDPVGPEVPGTFLRGHRDVVLWVDQEAARGLDDLLPPG